MSMDLITYLPCTARGYTAVIVFVDRLTNMVHFAPAEVEIFRHHDLPETIVSDRGTIFKGFFAKVCKQLCIRQNMSTAFLP